LESKLSKNPSPGTIFETDVAIVGAGPAGSTAAMEIAESGYDVVLIEKEAFPGRTNVCGGGILEKYVSGIDLPQEIIEKRVSRWIFHFRKKSYVLNQPAVSVRREVFDKFLAETAHRRGANLTVSTIAHDVNLSNDKVTVAVTDRVSQEHRLIQARLVIFADGPNTLSHRKFSLGFERKPDSTAVACIYEVEWKQNPLDSFDAFFGSEITPWGYGWIVPKRDLLNVGIMCLMSTMQTNIRNCLDNFIDSHPKVAPLVRERRITKFAAALIPLAPAKRIVGHRILVVGDAAGMVEPISGGGIGCAMRGARLAAKIAVRALHENRFDEAFLREFDREWRTSEDYKNILKQYLATRFFLNCLKLHVDAYSRLVRVLLWRSEAKEIA